jgi:hypothetical protein
MRRFVVLVVVVAVVVIAGATPIGARTAKEAAYLSAVHNQGVRGFPALMILSVGHRFCRDAKQGGFKAAVDKSAQYFVKKVSKDDTKAERKKFFYASAVMTFFAVDYFCPQFKSARTNYKS